MPRKRPYWETAKFFPRPAWRWERACFLVNHKMNASHVRDDKQTCELVGFRRAQLRADTDRKRRNVAKRFPNISAAYELACGFGRQKLELQARVLARQTAEEIAECTSVDPESVQWYELGFFDVRRLLHARDFIVFQVCRMPMQPSVTGVAWDTLFKLAAYRYGPHAVDAWLRCWDLCNGASGQQPDLSTVDGRMAKRIDLLLKLHNLPVPNDAEASLKLTKAYPILRRIMQPVPQPRRISEIVAHATTDLLNKLPWQLKNRSSAHARPDQRPIVEREAA